MPRRKGLTREQQKAMFSKLHSLKFNAQPSRQIIHDKFMRKLEKKEVVQLIKKTKNEFGVRVALSVVSPKEEKNLNNYSKSELITASQLVDETIEKFPTPNFTMGTNRVWNRRGLPILKSDRIRKIRRLRG